MGKRARGATSHGHDSVTNMHRGCLIHDRFCNDLFTSGKKKDRPVIPILQKEKSTERWRTCPKSHSGKGRGGLTGVLRLPHSLLSPPALINNQLG